MHTATTDVWRWLSEIPDPEVPAVSIVDLGIVRDVRHGADARLVVTVTPTYSGCPATEVIANSIREALQDHGVADARIEMQLSPAWTTDWLTPEAKEKLRRYGIAPPAGLAPGERAIDASRILRYRPADDGVTCPRCGSARTELISGFGSTPCKALYRCVACREPFDYFKPH
ncbi:MAG: phenylacetate-CoA oxygenase subunit PaaJ [Panacagrimonas sp.]|jgi:ring-1,2-phenylacetyl-CoA epoxidase subunit PaaD|nr:1,2-phenylacetyl-CoA epoxidase subunit PaaD [Panacagrimonas sp.]MCC2656670.1 phenylacetate-CoA oxygenase subunit PaaJ [Panacagrimonas sp.]